MVKLRDLQYLVALDDHKHFGRAAEACHVSQPTLSGQMMKLEDQLGLQLIERHKRRIMLTPAGQVLVEHARQVLAAAATFESSAKSLLDPLAGELNVGLIPTLAPYLLPHVMPDIHQRLPKINVYLHEEKSRTLLSKLNQGELDFLVLPYIEEADAFERYDLFEEELMLAVASSHSLAEKEQITLEDIRSETVLTLEDGHCLRDQALGYCFTAGAREDHRFQAASLETLRYMVSAGLGITLLPELATLNRKSDQGIVYRCFNTPAPKRKISLIVRPNYYRMELIRRIVASIRDSVRCKNLLMEQQVPVPSRTSLFTV